MKVKIISPATKIILLLLLPISCSEKLSEDVITYPIEEESKAWLYAGETGDTLIFSDSAGNSQEFIFDSEHTFLREQRESTGPFGWQEEIFALTERISRYYLTTNSDLFSVKLSANINDEPDEMTFELLSTKLSFYPENMQVQQLTIWYLEKDNSRSGRGLSGNDIKSTLEYADSITIGSITYHEVFKFRLLDLFSYWTDNTVAEFTYGKGTGLLQFRLEDGTEYIRVH